MTIYAYKRTYSLELFLPFAIAWSLVLIFVFLEMFAHAPLARDPAMYLGYFTAGIVTSNLCEGWHCYTYNRDLRIKNKQKQKQQNQKHDGDNDNDDDIDDDEEAHSHQAHSTLTTATTTATSTTTATTTTIIMQQYSFCSNIIISIGKTMISMVLSPDQDIHTPTYVHAHANADTNTNTNTNKNTNKNTITNSNNVKCGGVIPACIVPTLWRFLPDFLCVVAGILTSNTGDMVSVLYNVYMYIGNFI